MARHQGDSAATLFTTLTASKLAATGQEGEGECRLAVEPLRLEQGAILGGPLLEPGGEALFVDEMDGPGLLPAIGDEERSEIGHRPTFLKAPQRSRHPANFHYMGFMERSRRSARLRFRGRQGRRSMKRSISATILALVMGVIGIILAVGGAWLTALGGSPYYLIAGVAMLASAWFLFRGRLLGVWIYVGLFVLSAIWGFAEARGNAWAMVPWLIAPLVLLIAVLLVMPTLTPARNRWRMAGGGIAAALLFVIVSFAALGNNGSGAAAALPAQSSPGMSDPSLAPTGADWQAYGGTNAAWRFSPLTEVRPDNVGKLRKVWEVHLDGGPSNPDYAKLYGTENTPLKAGNLIYTCTAKNIIVALDAATGKTVWRVDPKVPDAWIPYTTACRGLSYYAVPGAAPNSTCAARIIEGTMDARLIEVDALTGKPCTEFNGNGQQDTKIGMGWTPPGSVGINSAPPVVRGIIVVGHQVLDGQCRCAPSGVIQGFDAKTGKLAWAWDMQHPDWNGYPPKGQTWARGTPNSWTTSAGDEKLGLAFVPTGNVAADYISAGRTPEENAFSSSIVAIDVTTGKPRWSFQTVKMDVWDYDIGSQPSLIDYKGTPALLVSSKQGDLYVLDRATGKLLTPAGTIQAPPGGLEPTLRSPTQIASLWNTLRKPALLESDMWGMSPIDQMICRIQYRQADYRGFYTPPSAAKNTVQYPGYNGGTDWGSVSIDPVRGVAIANYNDMPNYVRLIPREGQQDGDQAPVREPAAVVELAPDRPAMGRALRDPRQCRLADAVDQADVQAPALWRHPRHRHRDRQDLVGPSDRHRAAQRAVQHPDPAAAHHRHAQ